MLVLLGVLTLTGVTRRIQEGLAGASHAASARARHAHPHVHGDYVHTHVHGHAPGPTAMPRRRRRRRGSTARSDSSDLSDRATARRRAGPRARGVRGGGALGPGGDPRPLVGDGVSPDLRARDDRWHDADHGRGRRALCRDGAPLRVAQSASRDCLGCPERGLRALARLSDRSSWTVLSASRPTGRPADRRRLRRRSTALARSTAVQPRLRHHRSPDARGSARRSRSAWAGVEPTR